MLDPSARKDRRPRGRPRGWRAVPGAELAERLERARFRIARRGERPTQPRLAAELSISPRTLRNYLRERGL